MKILLKSLVLLLSLLATNCFAQVCELVNITTKPQLVLPGCNKSDGSIVFIDTDGGLPPYTYTLGNDDNVIGAFFDLPLGDYNIEIKDARSCTRVITVKLRYEELQNIIAPNNAFTPNGDGINDTWFIPGIESFDGVEVRVFNRWGQLVHLNSEYLNEMGWDGKQAGSDLPPATYYYVISIVKNCVEQYVNGTVTIVR